MAQHDQGAGVAEPVAALAEDGQGLPGVASGLVTAVQGEVDGGQGAVSTALW
jgi:hypothetical protein